MKHVSLLLLFALAACINVFSQNVPAPLYRDPITDGAADPCLAITHSKRHGGCYTHNAVPTPKQPM